MQPDLSYPKTDKSEVQNMPNTLRLLDSGVYYAVEWILIEDGSHIKPRHSRVSIKAITLTRSVKKSWKYPDFAYDLDVMYINISEMLKLSISHTESDDPSLSEIYEQGLRSLDEWYKANRLIERSDMAAFYFDISQ